MLKDNLQLTTLDLTNNNIDNLSHLAESLSQFPLIRLNLYGNIFFFCILDTQCIFFYITIIYIFRTSPRVWANSPLFVSISMVIFVFFCILDIYYLYSWLYVLYLSFVLLFWFENYAGIIMVQCWKWIIIAIYIYHR